MRTPALSISTKLITLIVVSIALIVAGLTAFLSTRQVDEIQRQIEDKADVYGALAATQLESAIAFRDPQTAREVFESLTKDRDLVGATVYTADGAILLHVGEPTVTSHPGDEERHVIAYAGGVEVTAPVVSKEGPRGTVVIEISSDGAQVQQHSALVAAIAFGLAMIVVGGVAAWLIARTIARRVHRLTDVAEVLADGYLDVTPPHDASTDEVGRLSRAFDMMVARLRASFAETRAVEEQKRHAIEQANLELERRIDLRTHELRDANAKLKQEMADREKMEIELRQAQKLESVGRLAAGVAHELNTPIQFVTDSCTFIDGASTSFIDVVGKAREVLERVATGELAPGDASEQLARDLDAADFAYLAEQVPPAVVRALDGLTRMATIVQSMKEFSHPDQTEKTLGDINRGLLATLEIARNEYKYVADVTTDLADLNAAIRNTLTVAVGEYKDVADVTTDLGDLPHVVCHIGELNQAFLNIIVNAAHAIGGVVGEGERGTIAVKTWATDDEIKIAISDSGGGIPESIRDRIFDPFFTTKEVGKGTGQGLAIVRSVVVDKHGGAITLDTEVGRGSTFTLTVPYRNAQLAA